MPSDFPKALAPTTTELLKLPSGRILEVNKAMPVFEPWRGEQPEDTYNDKATLDLDGKCVFAELAVLRLFQSSGWDGVWVDTFRRKFRTHYWNAVPVILPGPQQTKLDEIRTKAKSRYGCWDVYCWRDDRIVFAESKLCKKDKIRSTQLMFIDAAIDLGLPLDSFLVVEWTVKT